SERSIARASSASEGLPSRRPSQSITVSAPRTRPRATRRATASALRRARARTAASSGPGGGVSSTSAGTTSNGSPRSDSSSLRCGEADARISGDRQLPEEPLTLLLQQAHGLAFRGGAPRVEGERATIARERLVVAAELGEEVGARLVDERELGALVG